MANYLDSLDSTAKSRYIDRLTILGLTEISMVAAPDS